MVAEDLTTSPLACLGCSKQLPKHVALRTVFCRLLFWVGAPHGPQPLLCRCLSVAVWFILGFPKTRCLWNLGKDAGGLEWISGIRSWGSGTIIILCYGDLFSPHTPQSDNNTRATTISGALGECRQRDNIVLAPAHKPDIVRVCRPLVGAKVRRATCATAGFSRVRVTFKKGKETYVDSLQGGSPF